MELWVFRPYKIGKKCRVAYSSDLISVWTISACFLYRLKKKRLSPAKADQIAITARIGVNIWVEKKSIQRQHGAAAKSWLSWCAASISPDFQIFSLHFHSSNFRLAAHFDCRRRFCKNVRGKSGGNTQKTQWHRFWSLVTIIFMIMRPPRAQATDYSRLANNICTQWEWVDRGRRTNRPRRA